jgi:hypothetical protein
VHWQHCRSKTIELLAGVPGQMAFEQAAPADLSFDLDLILPLVLVTWLHSIPRARVLAFQCMCSCTFFVTTMHSLIVTHRLNATPEPDMEFCSTLKFEVEEVQHHR